MNERCKKSRDKSVAYTYGTISVVGNKIYDYVKYHVNNNWSTNAKCHIVNTARVGRQSNHDQYGRDDGAEDGADETGQTDFPFVAQHD